jgi:hypothetical protein
VKLLTTMKDGGPLSRVWGYFVIEVKWLLTLVLLRFEDGSREAYHTHAFNAVSWVLAGCLDEYCLDNSVTTYMPSLKPIYTPRDRFHMVRSRGTTWVISFRGPWTWFWKEYLPGENKVITLTHGRKVVSVQR